MSNLSSPFRISQESNLDYGDISVGRSNYEQQSRRTKSNQQLPMMSEIRLKSGSQFKVSEIMNPDGSITIRNLRIEEDGIWTKEEQELEFQQHESHCQSARAIDSGQRNRSEILPHWTPAIEHANSLQSSHSNTEAIGHQLRRRRLARSSLFDPSVNYSAEGDTSLTLPQTFRRSLPKNSTSYLSTNLDSSQVKHTGRSNSRTIHKHVAFSEPLSSAQIQRNTVSSVEAAGSENYTYLYDKKKRDMIIDIYNDLDRTSKQKLSSENSDADSSVFDNVAQLSSMDMTRKRWKDASVRKKQNRITYVDDDEEDDISNLYSVTVHKTSQNDKIGIYVHLETFPRGDRLVISKIADDGKFTNSRIKEGDIVVSITTLHTE